MIRYVSRSNIIFIGTVKREYERVTREKEKASKRFQLGYQYMDQRDLSTLLSDFPTAEVHAAVFLSQKVNLGIKSKSCCFVFTNDAELQLQPNQK